MRAATARANLRHYATVSTGRFTFADPRVVTAPRPAAFRPFGEWMAEYRSQWRWNYRHFVEMQRVLDAVTRGELRRVYFQVAIRHGKSEHNTVGYAAYRLWQNPQTRILLGSYNDKKAQKFSRETRRLAESVGVVLSTDRNAAGEWETTAGGGMQAVGAGAGVASVNADLIIIDDPIGSRDDAESPAKRDQVWDWLTNDILARCEPQTAVVMTMSRWHQDDPAGRLRDRFADRWTILDLPGRAEPNDPLGRALNEPLWPELRGEAWLDEKRAELLEYGFASLIQGRPRPREGGMFKWDHWQLLDSIPAVGPMVRYWDTAGTEAKGKSDPDYTVGALLCRMPDGRTAVVDVARFRHSVGQRDAEISRIAREDAATYRGRVRWWVEREAGVGGKDRTDAVKRLVQNTGIPISDEPATGNKAIRAEPLASAVEAGNVLLCPGLWRDPLRSEAADFPAGNHDDQVDAVAGAFNKLATPVHTAHVSTFSIG
jgi:predicted phage terminase large subunit-like protein